MKVVLFCGGLGMRLREYSETDPQADGHDRVPADPVARHEVLRPLRPQGLHPVPRLQGRRGQELLPATTTSACRTTSSCRTAARRSTLLNSDIHDWNITFVDTGINANIGQRLKAVEPLPGGERVFLANYSDGLTGPRPADLRRRRPPLGEDGELPVRSPHTDVPRRVGPRRGHGIGDRARDRVGRVDQRGILRPPPPDLRPDPRRRGSRVSSRSIG